MAGYAVIGGGISGLTTAFYLRKAGIQVTLYEGSKPGGSIQSEKLHETILDLGPNSLRDRNGDLLELIRDLELDDQVIQVSESFKTRCIVRDGKLQFLKPSPLSFLSSGILSPLGKLRLSKEPWVSNPASAEEDESVSDFLSRRIGKEAVDYLADPFFSGIYAGDISKLSARELIPALVEYESEYGSLTRGFFKNRKKKKNSSSSVLNFRDGIQTLTDKLANELRDHMIKKAVTRIEKSEDGYKVRTESDEEVYEGVISCIPAHALARILGGELSSLNETLNTIYYPPVMSTQILFRKDTLAHPPEGFGFLVPRKESFRLLGAIWKSSIFPEHSPDEYVHYNLLSGGAHDLFAETVADQVERQVIREFKQIMGIQADPDFVKSKYWEKAIPQQNLGYSGIRKEISTFESIHQNFKIGGNFIWGVAVPDCIRSAKKMARKTANS